MWAAPAARPAASAPTCGWCVRAITWTCRLSSSSARSVASVLGSSNVCSPASTRARMRSTRSRLAAPSWNSVKRRSLALPSEAASAQRCWLPGARHGGAACWWGYAEQVADFARPAPAQHLRRAVVAVGPQQDLNLRPVGADLAHKAAQEGADLAPVRPLGRTQHGGDEAAIAVEHHDGLEAVVVVVGVEQAQLLPAVHGVERVVHVQHDPARHLAERRAVEIDHSPAHAQQRACVRIAIATAKPVRLMFVVLVLLLSCVVPRCGCPSRYPRVRDCRMHPWPCWSAAGPDL